MCVGGPGRAEGRQWRPQISPVSGEGDSPEWSYPKQRSSLSPSGGKVYCQLAFVVGLKRFAAVSIKRHRSKETPLTEIPTEEGEEEQEEENEGGGKLIQTLKTDVKRSALYWLCTPTTTIIPTEIPTIVSCRCFLFLFRCFCFDSFILLFGFGLFHTLLFVFGC